MNLENLPAPQADPNEQGAPQSDIPQNMANKPAPRFTMSFGKRLLFLICLFVLFYVINAAIIGFLFEKWPMSVKLLRLASVMQDFLIFIIPALVFAVIATRRADWFLRLRRPGLWPTILAVCTLVMSIPAMNALIWLNESVQLPEWLSGLEQSLKAAEDSANNMAELLMPPGAGGMIMSILIMGVMAGFSEELFFRGTVQRLLDTGPCGAHAAIWITAFIFSAIHFQFYGFVPRMLLGAYFGYLIYWSRSLWVPVIAHAANNIMYVVAQYASNPNPGSHEGASSDPDLSSMGFWCLLVFSVVATAIGLYLIKRNCTTSRVQNNGNIAPTSPQ